jgi:uncharacterized membrane protein
VIKRLKRVLLLGLIILGPFSLTLMILSWSVALIDKALAPLIGLLGRPVPGLGLLVAFTLVLAAGVLGSNIFGRQLIEFVEELLLKIPVFRSVYRVFRDLTAAFSPDNASSFRGVALIEYPRPTVYSVGFITNRVTLETADGPRELVSVYVPTNHLYIGDTVLVPAESVLLTGMTTQEGVQATVSAGSALPGTIRLARKP